MFDLVDDTNTAALNKGYKQGKKSIRAGIGAIGNYEGQAQGYLDKAITPFEDISALGKKGEASYWDMINNPDSIFDSELYQSRERAGLEGINRMANSRGMLASGNNTQDLINYMRQGGLDYFNTLTNKFNPYLNMLGQGAQGLAGVYGGKAGAAMGAGTGIANQYSNLAGLQVGQGQDLTNIGMYDTFQDWGALMGLGNLAVGGAKAVAGMPRFGGTAPVA